MPKIRLRLPVGRYSDLGSRVQAMTSERPISPVMTPKRNTVLPLMRKTL